jgi:hypothetical protein
MLNVFFFNKTLFFNAVVQQPLKSPVSPSPQKMKNLRVPKPTERLEKKFVVGFSWKR